MRKKSLLLLSLLALYLVQVNAARVDTLKVKSASMNKEVEVVVIVPDAALGKLSLIHI